MQENNSFFPLFLDIKNKKILIIGAGKIAYRKAETLLKYGADIHILTKEIKEKKFENMKDVHIMIQEFSEKILDNVFMVIAATDDPEFNKKIYKLCSKKNILVNNITSKAEMNCRFGSIVETDDYLIGISGKGDPKKAKKMRENLERILTLEQF